MEREFVEGHGFPLLGVNFSHHQTGCKQCRKFNEKEPKTLAFLCLDGAILWKREQPAPPRESGPVNPNRVSKAVAKKAMRYK